MPDMHYEIPELERLLRDVVGRCFAELCGDQWLATLSATVQRGVQHAAAKARDQRPDEALSNDWDAAGLSEIAKATDSEWTALASRLRTVWPTREEMKVDLTRLQRFRGRTLHGVGPSIGQIQKAELGALILRLRVALEGVRRSVAHEDGDWWPYIESVYSNVESFNSTRDLRPRKTQLREGDLVNFEIVGINPLSDQSALRYKITVEGLGLNGEQNVWWQESPEFTVQIPRTRYVAVHLFVANRDDLSNSDEWVCGADVQPTF